MTITSDLKWNRHIDSAATKPNKVLGFLRRNLKVKSSSLKEKAYKTLVRHSMEYAAMVWDPYTQSNISRLEMVQRRAARYTLNQWDRCASVTAMLSPLAWCPLWVRRRDMRLVMLYKISNSLVKVPTNGYLLPVSRATRNCHALGFLIPHSSKEFHKFSFYPQTIREWNALPTHIPESDSLESFKSNLAA